MAMGAASRKSRPGRDFLKYRYVTTKKVHRCFECQMLIEKGTFTKYAVGVVDGYFCTGYFCFSCRQ